MTSLADFRYRRPYRLRVILSAMLLIILSAMFPLIRADANSMTAALPTHRHRHSLSMVGSTSCLNIAMLLMSIDIMFARSHHATDGRRHATLEHDHLLFMVGSAPCLNIRMTTDMLLTWPFIKIFFRPHHYVLTSSPARLDIKTSSARALKFI